MTLLGKIFTVLVFIMSLVFMTFAVCVYATHRNWRDAVLRPPEEAAGPDKPVGYQYRLEQMTQIKNEKEKELFALQKKTDLERAARRQALAALEAQLQQLAVALENKAKEHGELVSAHREAVAAVEIAQRNLGATRTEVVDLRGNIISTQRERDDLFNRAVALTEDLHQARGTEQRLKERNEQIIERYGKAKEVLQKTGHHEDEDVSGVPPKLEGVVLAVSSRGNVEVSVGSDDGLQDGHEMDVSRKGTYVGRVRISRVAPDRAVGVMIGTPRSPVQRGDRVQTKVD